MSEATKLLTDAGWAQAVGYDGKTPVAFVVRNGGLFAITAVDLSGVTRSGAREDPVSLAMDLLAMGEEPTPAVEPTPEPVPEPVPAPVVEEAAEQEAEPEPETKPEDDTAERLRRKQRQVHKLKAEIEALKKQLADAAHDNDALKDRIGELEAELAKANEPPPLLPDPTTSMLEFDESFKPLRGLMEDGETVSMAKKRLYPRLMEELQNLKNQEALFDKTIPRRAEVEQLLGILARVGEH